MKYESRFLSLLNVSIVYEPIWKRYRLRFLANITEPLISTVINIIRIRISSATAYSHEGFTRRKSNQTFQQTL